MTPAAFQGAYSDLRFIKTRSVAAITVEIPIEQAGAFVAAFGAPTPGAEVPVAIARLVPEKPADDAPEPAPKERRKFSALPYPTQAAMRCNEEAFRRFLAERNPCDVLIFGQETAADEVRSICGVKSRADLATESNAGLRWARLNRDYEAWLHAPEAIG